MNRWWLLLILLVAGGGYYLWYYGLPLRAQTNEVYLTRYASIMTPSGVYGFAPGTKATLDPTRQVPAGTVAVTDGKHELALDPDALTHNAELAQQYADADQQGQVQAAATAKAAKAHVIQAENQAQLKRAQDMDRLYAKYPARTLSTPTPKPTPAPTRNPMLGPPPPP